jgi:hypothetical protein
MLRTNLGLLTALTLALALPQTACGGDDGGGSPDATPPNQASVALTAPATSDCAGTVTAGVTVQNFVLEEATGQANQEGHGHYHIYLDDATAGDYLVVDFNPSTDVKLPVALAAGDHTLRVELANNDHSPIGVSATAPLAVTDNPCVGASVAPTTLAPGAGATVTIEVNNFILEEPELQPNQDGHGHYHVYLDNRTGTNYLVSGAATPVDVTIPAATPVGSHTLRVSISDNNHAPLLPPVETILDITVQ